MNLKLKRSIWSKQDLQNLNNEIFTHVQYFSAFLDLSTAVNSDMFIELACSQLSTVQKNLIQYDVDMFR